MKLKKCLQIKNPFVQVFLKITLASGIACAYYMLLLIPLAVLRASLASYDFLNELVIPVSVSTIFSFALLFVAKKFNKIGDEELLADYAACDYTSKKEDLKITWERERRFLLEIAIINVVATIAVKIDMWIFQTPKVTGPLVIFVPMRILTSMSFLPEIIGLIVSTVYVCGLYLLLVLSYRKKRYTLLDRHQRLEKYKNTRSSEYS